MIELLLDRFEMVSSQQKIQKPTIEYDLLLHNIDFGSGIKPFNKYKYFH